MADQLYFFSRSSDKPVGKGVNEIVKNEKEYENLNKIKDWRKILSNFHVYDFAYKGYTWKTVEHAFQSSKIGLVDEKKAFLFTVDSDSEIGKIAQKNRKMVILDKKTLGWN
jgi:hypothetical protein